MLDHAVVAARALRNGATCRVRSRAVKQALTTAGAWDRIRWASAAKSDTNRFEKFLFAEDSPVVFAQVP